MPLRELRWISTTLQPSNGLHILNYSILFTNTKALTSTLYCCATSSHTTGKTSFIRHFSSSVKKMCSPRARKVPVWYFSSKRKGDCGLFFLKCKITKTRSLLAFSDAVWDECSCSPGWFSATVLHSFQNLISSNKLVSHNHFYSKHTSFLTMIL